MISKSAVGSFGSRHLTEVSIIGLAMKEAEPCNPGPLRVWLSDAAVMISLSQGRWLAPVTKVGRLARGDVCGVMARVASTLSQLKPGETPDIQEAPSAGSLAAFVLGLDGWHEEVHIRPIKPCKGKRVAGQTYRHARKRMAGAASKSSVHGRFRLRDWLNIETAQGFCRRARSCLRRPSFHSSLRHPPSLPRRTVFATSFVLLTTRPPPSVTTCSNPTRWRAHAIMINPQRP